MVAHSATRRLDPRQRPRPCHGYGASHRPAAPEGEGPSASRELRAPTQGLPLLIPRFNSALPPYPLYRHTSHIARKKSRLSLAAAAALAAGVLGATAAAAHAAPQPDVLGSVTASTHIASGLQADAVQLDSLVIPTMGGITTTTGAAQAAQAPMAPASEWARTLAHAPVAVAGATHAHSTQTFAAHTPAAAVQPSAARVTTAHPVAPAPKATPSQAAPAKAASPPLAPAPAKPYLIYDSTTR